MLINPWVVRHLVYPFIFPLARRGASGRAIMRCVGEWEEMATWPPERIREHALGRLQAIVQHAFHHVPLYREKYQDAGFEPGDLKSWQDFAQLPLLTREELRNRPDDLLAGNIPLNRRDRHRTSGSTGIPCSFWIDKSRASLIFANYHFNMRWLDCEVGDPQLWLWPDPVGPVGRRTWLRRFSGWLIGRSLFFSPNFGDDQMAMFHEWFQRSKAELLVGFPMRFVYYLRYLRRMGLEPPKVKSVICTGECLLESQRRSFEEAFGAKVYNRYGSIELGDIAQECKEQQGLHVNAHRVWVETHPIEGLGEGQGMLLATDLHNLSTPFIRYESGDIGELWPEDSTHDCPCGRRFPRLKTVTGRTTDILESPSGKIYARMVFTSIPRKVPGIDGFQIIHRKPNSLTFRYQVNSEFPQDGEERIRELMFQNTGGEFDISVELVEELSLSPSGKLRVLIHE